MTDTPLKPCPFCGGEPALIGGKILKENVAYVMCTVCRCETATLNDDNTILPDPVAKAWNTRAPDPEVARLKEALINIAEQQMTDEMEDGLGDIEYGYDAIIQVARTALKESE